MRKMVELDQPTNERATGGRPGINSLTGQPQAPAAPQPDHLAEPPARAPADPNAPNLLANKTRMPDPAAAARAQRGAMANDLANQQQPREGNEFSGALAKAKASGEKEFEVDGKRYQVKEDGTVEECGMGMGPHEPMKQQDTVSMNVSMNGSGAGGIRDLMSILRNIENGDSDSDSGFDIEPEKFGDKDMDIIVKKEPMMSIDDDFANEPDEIYSSMDAVTRTGNDIHSKGKEAPKVNGGGNPMPVESGTTYKLPSGDLKVRLESLYQEIKSR